jgi:NAD+ synthase
MPNKKNSEGMMSKLLIDTDRAQKIIIRFIQDQMHISGLNHLVIGLSGGIDSGLACFLISKAIGPQNVLAVRLPYQTSSPASLEDAQMVIDSTGVNSKTIEITDMVDGYTRKFPQLSPLRRGNIMARTRMIILYDQSADFNGLVTGTGNKTEYMLGYTTLYGDAACAFNPVGDLYKTQVRQLARVMGMPEKIISKSPSADLWTGQTDEGEMGFSYDDVDQLLYMLIEERYSVSECCGAGIPEPFVRRVIGMINKNGFKRRLPPVARISPLPVGEDWIYPDEMGLAHNP